MGHCDGVLFRHQLRVGMEVFRPLTCVTDMSILQVDEVRLSRRSLSLKDNTQFSDCLAPVTSACACLLGLYMNCYLAIATHCVHDLCPF